MSKRVRLIDCRRCGERRRRGGRGLCERCCGWARYHGLLDQYPRSGVSVSLIAEEAFHPGRPQERPLPGDSTGPCRSAAGRQFMRTAQELGLSPGAANRAYYRARERGLLQEAQ